MGDGASMESQQENPDVVNRRDNYAHQFIEGTFFEWDPENQGREIFKTPEEIAYGFAPWVKRQIAGARELKEMGQPSELLLDVLSVFTLKDVADYAQKKLEKEKTLPHSSNSQLKNSWEMKAKLAKDAVVVSKTPLK